VEADVYIWWYALLEVHARKEEEELHTAHRRNQQNLRSSKMVKSKPWLKWWNSLNRRLSSSRWMRLTISHGELISTNRADTLSIRQTKEDLNIIVLYGTE